MGITVSGITKKFGNFPALHSIDLEARPGEFLALLGPSGSGKTTLLRIIAGLEFPDAGAVYFDGEDVTDKAVADRKVGFVFQQYALFRHMTVAENVAFGLNVRKRRLRPARAEIKRRVAELLDLVQLGHLGERFPSQLSGGQRQRVRWPARSRSSRASCCSMSPSARSTPRCARICAAGCASCTTGWASPRSSSRTIRRRRSSLPTVSS
jgi:sulfate transport system ATP-binding protein